MRASVYLLFGLLSVSTAFAQPFSVVSPSGLEDTDGNYSYVPENRPYPATLPVHTPNGWRGQGLHVSAAFESLGPGPFEITGLAWRPDISVNAPVTAVWQMTVLMSTTAREAESLSSTFADNYGADGVTQVFSGSAQFQTDGVPRGDGLPHEFDYVVEFDTPYVYDPQKGNLLLDMASPTDIGTVFLWTDGDLRTVAHVLALSEGTKPECRVPESSSRNS